MSGEAGAAGEAGESGGSTGSNGVGGKSGGVGIGEAGASGAATGGSAGTSSTGDAGASSTGDAGASGAPGSTNKCPAGFADCDANPADCETSLSLSTSCGACNTSCDGSHGSVSCVKAACVVASCASGYGDCDNNGATGCETPINTDTHCGDCTRNCAAVGSTCSSGKCAAVTVLSTGGSGYQSAFVAGDSLYVMNTNSMPPGNYTTTRVPLNGSAPSKITDNEAGGPGLGVLNADASYVYWAIQGSPPSVLKKSVTAQATDLNTVVFHPVATVRYMTIVGNAYYWMSQLPWTLYTRSTSALATDTGTQIVTIDQTYVSSFRATTDAIYWVKRPASTTSLVYVPFAGGTPATVPDSVVADSAPLYSVGNTLYFVRNVGSAPENGVYKYTTGDTTVTQLVQSNSVTNIIVDANAVYYTVGYDGLVYKAPLTGQNGVPIASSFPGVFGGQDATFLYAYASWGSDGPVKKLLK
jgi:hypothetical protein